MKKLLLIALFSLPFIVACSDDENEMKVSLGNAVIEYIDSRYEGARIRGSEYEENGLLEVEIVHEGKVKDVYFNSQNEWVYTSWDVRVKDLPQAVTSAVAGAYPGYRIDDADFIEIGLDTVVGTAANGDLEFVGELDVVIALII